VQAWTELIWCKSLITSSFECSGDSLGSVTDEDFRDLHFNR